MEKQKITVRTSVQAPIEKTWNYWTMPEHVTQWNCASPDWHSPSAKNDLRENGKFSFRMEAKDGSAGFDFEGTYNFIEPHKTIAYTLADEREVRVNFMQDGDITTVEEIFEAESTHSIEMQKEGWQAILESFRKYTESH